MIEVKFKEYDILIGQNEKENDQLVKTSDPNDYWLHLSGLKIHPKKEFIKKY